MHGDPAPDTWAVCGSHLDAWVPYRTPHGHLGPLQFRTPQKPGSPMEHPPWKLGSPIDPPPAPTCGSPTYPPSPTACLGSSQSPPADTLVPYASLTRTCMCASVSLMASGVSGIPPTPPRLFYSGPSWAQWARIQEEGQGKEQGPADVWGEPGIQEAPLPLAVPPRSLGSH